MLTPSREGTLLSVRVVPGARKSEVVGEERGRLKVRVAAPPVDDKANRELLKTLARSLGLRKNRMVLVKGRRHRDKVVLLKDLAGPEAEGLLAAALPNE